MKKNSRRPTMTDIARTAGVSQTTVSFVINKVVTANISEETRARVMEAARQLGYRNGETELHLQESRAHLIGFLTDEIGTSPFAGDALKGAQDIAWSREKMIVLLNTGGRKEVEEAAIRTLLDRKVEGIVYAAMFTRQVNPPPLLRTTPTVLMNCYLADHSLSSVIPDEIRGGRTATEKLLKAGRKRIALINGEPWMDASRDRLLGYEQAHKKHGLTVDPLLIRYGNWRPDSGYSQTMALMRLSDRPNAIFCGNDLVAVGAYEALKELGLQVPHDVAVIGYDNQEQIAAYMRPSLSTMALPHYEMGQWAVHHLLERIENNDKLPILTQKLECPFIERESIVPKTTG